MRCHSHAHIRFAPTALRNSATPTFVPAFSRGATNNSHQKSAELPKTSPEVDAAIAWTRAAELPKTSPEVDAAIAKQYRGPRPMGRSSKDTMESPYSARLPSSLSRGQIREDASSSRNGRWAAVSSVFFALTPSLRERSSAGVLARTPSLVSSRSRLRFAHAFASLGAFCGFLAITRLRTSRQIATRRDV